MRQIAWFVFLVSVTSAKEQTRWSRQISSYTSDMTDWIPLHGPITRPESQTPVKRQAVAQPRILSEPIPAFPRPGYNQDEFARLYQNPSRQLYLQSFPAVPSAPQNFLNDQGFGQSIRFGLSQPNYPLTQGFVAPQISYENFQQQQPVVKPRQPQQIPVQFPKENFQKLGVPLSPQAKPFNQPVLQPTPKPNGPKYVDGYRVDNTSFVYQKKPQSLQKIKFERESPKMQVINKPKIEREEVQLVYMPVDSLNRGQFNFRPQNSAPVPQVHSDVNTQSAPPAPTPQQPQFASDFQRPIVKPLDNFGFGQNYFPSIHSQFKQQDQIPKFSTLSPPFHTLQPVTSKPKKLKPHQPPLAVFLAQEAKKGDKMKVGDVLLTLKNAHSIAVLDSVNPNTAPKVFIGPSTLAPPENYVKFDLPYLSNIDHSDRKLRQLPFFVAPLSYNTPTGFAKIPFPSPHVGSVIINSQIRESAPSTPAADVIPNSYISTPPPFKQEQKTQKPTFSYYSTVSPKQTPVQNQYQSNYYQFEPQGVNPLRAKQPDNTIVTAPPNNGNYYLDNKGQYTPQFQKEQYQTTPKPTPTKYATTEKPSTYPSQLLETHNPYSINQAFHLSTPLDSNSDQEDGKEAYATPGYNGTDKPVPASNEVTEKPKYQQSPNYIQNYNPEIHYESEVQNSRYPSYNTNEYSTANPQTENSYSNEQGGLVETQSPKLSHQSSVEKGNESEYQPNYEQYDYSKEVSDTTTTSTTTTTKRAPIRTRTRPRSTTQKPDEDITSRTVTRRPLRERRPLPSRSRYEPNKITTERPSRRPSGDNRQVDAEATTRSTRSRQRGKVQFKPTSNEELDRKPSNQGSKEQDLAYQRDILHQNYPVTLMERMSTVDIEAITEPLPRISSTRNIEPSTETYDHEQAYSNEQLFAHNQETEQTRAPETQTETSYVPRLPTTQSEEYFYRGSKADTYPPSSVVPKEEAFFYPKSTTPIRISTPEIVSIATEPSYPATEQPKYTINEYLINKSEERATTPQEEPNRTEKEEEHIPDTTPSYNRVRVRPGGVKQYIQQTTTESPTQSTKFAKNEFRKRPQAVTYRPAYDKRRTTMRIDEIEADLKTKQVRQRQEQSDRHPVYKPDPTTETPYTNAPVEVTSRRGQFRRRKPSYSTTSTEASAPRKSPVYDNKNRFRGRRPTEKPSEKSESQTDAPTTSTSRNIPYSRYTRPKLSERYNKKPVDQSNEDQEANYSYNRPKYASPDERQENSDKVEQWSSKYSIDAFKPYNPNDLQERPSDRRSNGANTEELDIITVRNEDILLSVTPATNRLNKKVPEIPPTLEALVEQSKAENGESTFESMLEEVMKSLEEQDENEYTTNVMKHKGGEIGEIPPENIISSEDKTTVVDQEVTSARPVIKLSIPANTEQNEEPKNRRRGFWKKVNVRPVTTESIDVAETQYYGETVNHLGLPVKTNDKHDQIKKATTYKPAKNYVSQEDVEIEAINSQEIPKVSVKVEHNTPARYEYTTDSYETETTNSEYYSPTTTESTKEVGPGGSIDRSDAFSFMDYIFGVEKESLDATEDFDAGAAAAVTTESNFVPEEITEVPEQHNFERNSTATTQSSYMDPEEVISTSMSTHVSHETEICFRGKCIKTKD